MSLGLKSNHFVLPVTALEIVSINNLQYICAGKILASCELVFQIYFNYFELGIGPRLLILSAEDGRHQSQCDVLDHHCIHGIRVVPDTDHTHWLVVFGQKAVTIVTIDPK